MCRATGATKDLRGDAMRDYVLKDSQTRVHQIPNDLGSLMEFVSNSCYPEPQRASKGGLELGLTRSTESGESGTASFCYGNWRYWGKICDNFRLCGCETLVIKVQDTPQGAKEIETVSWKAHGKPSIGRCQKEMRIPDL